MKYDYDVCVFGGCALDLTFYADKNGNYNEEAVCKVQYASGIKIMSETAQFGMPCIDELDKYYNKYKKIL